MTIIYLCLLSSKMPGIVLRLVTLFSLLSQLHCDSIDPNGYVVYCPCMGRFGNQADHFLGSLAFAHGINRTLVLPHWVEYRLGEARSIQVPFETYFNVKSFKPYHRVITMNKFMSDIAEYVWPVSERISFCYVSRGTNQTTKSCNAKEGNPFGPFWDTFNIDFVSSEYYAPLHYDVHRGSMIKEWSTKYPADKWPVLAFTGAPASFPVQNENRILQQYLQWDENVMKQAKDYIKTTFKHGGFIGLHLRNGADWVRACQHVNQSPALFAAPQCVGYRNEHGTVTHDMCLPSKHFIIKQIKRLLKTMKDVKYIFVASDSNYMKNELTEAVKRHPITVHHLDESNPHLDLAILGLSNHFVGNCVSSYSAFVKRERDVRGFPSSFWAFPTNVKATHGKSHDEL